MASRVTAEALGAFEILEGVSLTARQELLFASDERELESQAVLIQQGQPNETMYFLLSGQLSVHLDSPDAEPLALISAGETVGELSVLDGSVASAWVVAHDPSVVLAVGEDAFWALINASHAFSVKLLISLGSRLRANNAAVSASVEKRRMYERAAMFDGLTGIHNRRWLDETLERLANRLERDWGDLSLALIDIDHFKGFNDTYGHEAGDHVLAEVARTLAANLRPTDLVARFGGEEFVIIFPETNLDSAWVAAERVRGSVKDKTCVMSDGRELPRVTISVGVAQLHPGQSVGSLLKVADAAMYEAKRSGRDRVLKGHRPSDV